MRQQAPRKLSRMKVWLVMSALLGLFGPASGFTQETTRVSVASDGSEANDWSSRPTLSADGRYVVFDSQATNLVVGDTNASADVFVHDRQTSITERVSVASDGSGADGWSYRPAISADGRYASFASWATNLVPGDTNARLDVFVHDRQTGVTERVSVASDGSQATGMSSEASAISADGRYVAFASSATNLVPGDTNAWQDIFVHDRQSDITERVSVASDGSQTNLESFEPAISPDGRYVAFASSANNLVVGDTNNRWDIFVHDRLNGITERVSVASNGSQGNDDSSDAPAISVDGRYVAFASLATNLVAGDANNRWDIFVHDRQTGVTERVSVASDGSQANANSWGGAISADGRNVVFLSNASNLVVGDTNAGQDFFVHDRQTGVTQRVSVASNYRQANFPTSSIYGDPAISADGRYVAFESLATNLIVRDTNADQDIFVRGVLEVEGRMSDVVVDFGLGVGLWVRINLSAEWYPLEHVSPDRMVVGDVDGNGRDDVIADFGSTLGGVHIKRNLQGFWNKLHDSSTEMMATGDLDGNGQDDVVIAFGALGLWAFMNDESWLMLGNAYPDQLAIADMDGNGEGDVIGNFSSSVGGLFIKRNLGGWSQLHNNAAESIVVGDLDNSGQDDVVIDFGGLGLWARMNDSAWLQIHNNSPSQIAAGDMDGNGADDVIASFTTPAAGVWQNLNLGAWSQISNYTPDHMITGNFDGRGADDLVADFTSTIGGLYEKNNGGTWSKINNSSAEVMVVGNIDGN